MRRSQKVQFSSCQTQPVHFYANCLHFILSFIFIQHTLYTTIWSQVDSHYTRRLNEKRDIYVVRSSQFIFCLSHSMTLFLKHSRLDNKAIFYFLFVFSIKYTFKSDNKCILFQSKEESF